MTPFHMISGGLAGSVVQVAITLATLLFILMLVALAAFAYQSLTGDGIEWPDDREDADTHARGGDEDDDEWEYY
ncbi:MAG: hypothetical protein A07HR60_00408 [uncultured archaeon A07HR60]|nr:MAG: hypothetical protein A07HR60_00408 [uncultured archaeon A07HR60]